MKYCRCTAAAATANKHTNRNIVNNKKIKTIIVTEAKILIYVFNRLEFYLFYADFLLL